MSFQGEQVKKAEKTYLVKEDERRVERAYLVGLHSRETGRDEAAELVAELAELVRTLGIAVAGREIARVRQPNSRLLVGEGRARAIVESARLAGADVIVFDDPLSPSQQRNWEQLSDMAVIDRQEVILDIFGARARTREAVLQVALARATYALPRLKRRWTHLHRQRGMAGGMGMRGEGEQQIELDARLVGARIAQLKRQLAEVQKQRRTQRHRRLRKPVPMAALVGYTNAGKSSLLNVLTRSEVLVEDKLFATLDPTVRRVALDNHQEFLLVDTVGFIRKLPHLLVEAFKSTLEETLVADFLIEVVDVTSTEIEEHHETTRRVLREIGGYDKPMITVYNKIDLLDDDLALRRLRRRYPDALFVSARTGAGLDTLTARLAEQIATALREVTLLLPHARYDLVAALHRGGAVHREEYLDEGIRVRASVPRELFEEVAAFLVSENRENGERDKALSRSRPLPAGPA
jgi:GTP-binding protein HflX